MFQHPELEASISAVLSGVDEIARKESTNAQLDSQTEERPELKLGPVQTLHNGRELIRSVCINSVCYICFFIVIVCLTSCRQILIF